MKRIALIALGVVAAVGVGLAIGIFVGDDSDQVDELEAQVEELESDADVADSTINTLGDQLAASEDRRQALQDRLKSELAISGEQTAAPAGGKVQADYPFDAAGQVGPFAIKPTTLDQTSSGWLLGLTVNNTGDDPLDPFCAGDAAMVDTAGRTFDGDSVLADDTDNCGDSLQPGLNGYYEVQFKTPPDAKPAGFALVGDSFVVNESDAKVWAAP
jgi:uncharacterized coiled-coil protein SlyX